MTRENFGRSARGIPLSPVLPASKWTITATPRKYRTAGITAALQISIYGIPRVSAMMKATAPMTGGMICPPMEAVASTAPANSARNPVRFMRGMVKAPVVTTLAMAEPFTVPRRALEKMATFAGPPFVCPARHIARSEKKPMIPACSR